jgi:hypothetical protein
MVGFIHQITIDETLGIRLGLTPFSVERNPVTA